MIRVKNLKKHFKSGILAKRTIKAVDGVSFAIKKGECFGVTGESGCGKTTLARLILGLIKPTAGEIYIDGRNVLELKNSELKGVRPKYQIIWQQPQEALNPRMKIKASILEPLKYYRQYNHGSERQTILKYCDLVGLRPEVLNRFPHELSGGENQRAVIARILIMEPEFIIADEPTSALDVCVQAQILNLLKHIQQEFNITYLFISHDFEIIRYMCHQVAVMAEGKIIENGSVKEIFASPKNYLTEPTYS